MHQRKRQRRGIERLDRKMQHHAGIFADRIEHDRLFELGDHLAHDLDRLGLESPEMLWQCFARGAHVLLHSPALGQLADQAHNFQLRPSAGGA